MLDAGVKVRVHDPEATANVKKEFGDALSYFGAPSQASYVLADGVADRTRAASAEMLDKHPLYPGLDLA